MTPKKGSGGDAKDDKIAITVQSKTNEPLPGKLVTAGKGKSAEEMARLAREARVEVKQDPELVARLLSPEADRAIPNRVFDLIAEVINFTFELDASLEEPGD